MIAPPELFVEVKDFEISDFNPFLSDVHCAMSFGILSKTKQNLSLKNHNVVQKIKWDEGKSSVFVENIDTGDLERLKNLLENFSASGNQINADIELFVQQTNDILSKAKEKTFESKTIKILPVKKRNWYDQTLTRAKNKFHAARKKKKQSKYQENK